MQRYFKAKSGKVKVLVLYFRVEALSAFDHVNFDFVLICFTRMMIISVSNDVFSIFFW